jgi:hypothetical protein
MTFRVLILVSVHIDTITVPKSRAGGAIKRYPEIAKISRFRDEGREKTHCAGGGQNPLSVASACHFAHLRVQFPMQV